MYKLRKTYGLYGPHLSVSISSGQGKYPKLGTYVNDGGQAASLFNWNSVAKGGST